MIRRKADGRPKADDLEQALADFADALAAKPECFSAESVKRHKAAARKAASEAYDDYLLGWFKLLDKAKLVPKHIRGASLKDDRKVILAAMWRLWESSWPTMDGESTWLAMPFVARDLLHWGTIKGKTRKGLRKKNKAVFPDDKKWKKSFGNSPKKAKFVC